MYPKNNGVYFVGGVSPGHATDACIVNGKIYVMNYSKISMFDAETLAYLGSFGSEGSGDGQFYSPFSLCSDGQYIYVSDTHNHRIQKFTLAGQFVAKIGSQGNGDDQFDQPFGIRYHNGYLYIADTNNARVKIHNASDLSYVNAFTGIGGSRIAFVDSENNYLVVRAFTEVFIYKLSDKTLVRSQADLVGGWGAYLVDGYIYLSDWSNHSIRKYNYSDFSYVGDYSPGQDSSPGQLSQPFHLYYWQDKNIILCGNLASPCYVVGITPELEWKVFDLD